MLLKTIYILITNFINPSNPFFNAHYIIQYLHLDVRPDLVHNIRGTVTVCIAYCEYVLSLKMAFIAKTGCWKLLIGIVVYILNLHLFYYQYTAEHLLTNNAFLPTEQNVTCKV